MQKCKWSATGWKRKSPVTSCDLLCRPTPCWARVMTLDSNVTVEDPPLGDHPLCVKGNITFIY